MDYDVLIKDARIVDGTGGPAFSGDVAIKDGTIREFDLDPAEFGLLRTDRSDIAGGDATAQCQTAGRWQFGDIARQHAADALEAAVADIEYDQGHL